MTDGAGGSEPSYIDYDTFLDPSFSPHAFANTLVLATNNASDSDVDLNAPLSRVLFDVQDVDTRIDSLTSSSAQVLLDHTRRDVAAGSELLDGLDEQLSALTASYDRLHREVIERHRAADEARVASERLWRTVKLARAVGRCTTLARQLEAQLPEVGPSFGAAGGKREDFGAMVRCANTIVALHQIFRATGPGDECEGIDRINVVRSLRTDMLGAAEDRCVSRAEQIVGQFSMSTLTGPAASTGAAAAISVAPEDARSRATSALLTLYLLSPIPGKGAVGIFEPSRLVGALHDYLRRAITSSVAGLSSGLAALPKLDQTLVEVSARCQNIVALELLLETIKPPEHPMLGQPSADGSPTSDLKNSLRAPDHFLQPLLHSLDTSSLPSYFWRSMAGQLSARTQKIVRDGGVSARTLRSNKERVREMLRECVDRGSQLPASALGRGKTSKVRNWEREAAVMVGSVINQLGR